MVWPSSDRLAPRSPFYAKLGRIGRNHRNRSANAPARYSDPLRRRAMHCSDNP